MKHPFTQGGYGAIYLGTLSDGLMVAIKCIEAIGHWCEWRPEENGLKCDHPGILKAIGFARIGGHILLVSPWMKNGPLMGYITHHSWINQLRLSIELVVVVEHLHSQGIVNGDIKPDNILVSDDGHIRLKDFGSAVFLCPRTLCFTKTCVKGTLRFMSPEILGGTSNQCSTQSDVYAIGMTILQIIPGELPYANKNDFQVWAAVVNENSLPTRPDLHKCLGIRSEDADNALWDLLRRYWNPDPDDRPGATEIKEVLMETDRGLNIPGGFN
ncbi:hypothetical protein FRC11_008999 [Ceratobasidium sp. 423]|nr:hypothetical protein FRC11_008999 [Ceratobasidium sp. 423]